MLDVHCIVARESWEVGCKRRLLGDDKLRRSTLLASFTASQRVSQVDEHSQVSLLFHVTQQDTCTYQFSVRTIFRARCTARWRIFCSVADLPLPPLSSLLLAASMLSLPTVSAAVSVWVCSLPCWPSAELSTRRASLSSRCLAAPCKSTMYWSRIVNERLGTSQHPQWTNQCAVREVRSEVRCCLYWAVVQRVWGVGWGLTMCRSMAC